MNFSYPQPWNIIGNTEAGLMLKLKSLNFTDPCFEGGITIHSTHEIPTILFKNSLQKINYGTYVEILIDVDYIIADDEIQHVSMDQRKCFFKGERRLKFFKTYSIKNCLTECLHDLIIQVIFLKT
jgi:Amiloride-sensitive sodium channel